MRVFKTSPEVGVPYPTISDVNLFAKKVLIRLDLNVPMENGVITDAIRIERALPTLRDILAKNPKRVVIVTHLGRPKGIVERSLTLKPVADKLAELLKKEVTFEPTPLSPKLLEKIETANVGSVIMLENVRFYAGEENNDEKFAKELSAYGDIFVNDAFACAHRAHASVTGVTRYLPAYAGSELEAEVKALESVSLNPKRPVLGIVGGGKVSTKIDLLTNLLDQLDFLFVGGAMANTFLAAENYSLGRSTVERESLAAARKILEKAKRSKCEFLLPKDAAVARDPKSAPPPKIANVTNIADDEAIYDIGEKTLTTLKEILKTCRTVIWNGPVGMYEALPFAKGSLAIAETIGDLTALGEIDSMAGGGDTLAVIAKANRLNDFSHASTGGGAFLEWLEGKELPGLACLKNKKRFARDF